MRNYTEQLNEAKENSKAISADLQTILAKLDAAIGGSPR